MNLPWPKHAIIDAVRRALEQPSPVDFVLPDSTRAAIACGALIATRHERAAPYVEHALWQRIVRVAVALREGRDPELAFEIPLDIEGPLTPEVQMSASYREMMKVIESVHRDTDRSPR